MANKNEGKGEFRKHGKNNCNVFDLIESPNLEVKQTLALGFLLSKSQTALNDFLNLIGEKALIGTFDKWIVECEAHGVKKNNENGRIDILIRFYKGYNPVRAVIVEAKSVSANTSAKVAASQAQQYETFSQLEGFAKPKIVTLTKDRSFLGEDGNPITWSDLVSKFKGAKDSITKDFINFLLNIKGNMYYEEEVVSIPAGGTYDYVKEFGIYECDLNYEKKGHCPNKRTLFITFRSKGGIMTTLYKVIDVVDLHLDDTSAISNVDQTIPGFEQRITNYKKALGNYGQGLKKVYVLDLNNPLELPYPAQMVENNTVLVYYKLSTLIGKPNCNLPNTRIVDKLEVVGDELSIGNSSQGNRTYTLKKMDGTLVTDFSSSNKCTLNQNESYDLFISGKKNMRLNNILISYNIQNDKWELYYKF